MTLFFWSPRRKIGDLRKNLCCSTTGNSAWRSNHTRTAKVCDNRLFGNYSAKSLELPLMAWRDCTNFCWRLQFFQVKTKKRSQPTATQSHYHPSPSLFATTRASWWPFSTATVRRWLPKFTEETCQCLFQLTKFGEGCYKPEGGFSTPSTPLYPPLHLVMIVLSASSSSRWTNNHLIINLV